MAAVVSIETPLQDDVRVLVAALNEYLMPLSPREFQFQMTVEQMADADTAVFVARNDSGEALGIGALKRHDEALGEVKRMFTRPELRGQRIGAQLLDTIKSHAQALGLKRLVLETGSTAGFEPAWRLYQNGGFRKCGAVLDYPDSGYSAFFELELAQESAVA